jgi:hypothetical protein
MAPLVPEIVSGQFNYVIAFLLGIGFGFILEQAGFSSTKKLVGLFYGYDFTVLRVFFTAGVTAMIGVMLLGHLGWLDLSIIYINPTFLWSAIIGGLIMGAGFVIGGFCPGTSFCAAAIGKIDAFAFIFGSLIGILAFTEGFPLLEDLYMAEARGPIKINAFFNISPEFFGLILTFIALLAFYFTTRIENHINGKKTTYPKRKVMRYSTYGSLAIFIIILIWITPDHEQRIQNRIAKAEAAGKCNPRMIDADKLAYELINNYYEVNLIDVRSPEDYGKYHLPMAINIPFDSITNREWRGYFTQDLKKNVFYSDVDSVAKRACLRARFMGDSDNYVLKQSTEQFKTMFFPEEGFQFAATSKEKELQRFRKSAAEKMKELNESLKNLNKPVKKKVRRIQGGCS